MVHIFKVAEFVHHHVIDNFDGGHDKTPVEIEVFGAGTASPTGFLVAEGDPVVFEAIVFVEKLQAIVNDFFSFLFIEFLHGFFDGFFAVRKRSSFV